MTDLTEDDIWLTPDGLLIRNVKNQEQYEALKKEILEALEFYNLTSNGSNPYSKIFFEYKELKDKAEILDHIRNCHNCGSIGWSNCKIYRQEFDK